MSAVHQLSASGVVCRKGGAARRGHDNGVYDCIVPAVHLVPVGVHEGVVVDACCGSLSTSTSNSNRGWLLLLCRRPRMYLAWQEQQQRVLWESQHLPSVVCTCMLLCGLRRGGEGGWMGGGLGWSSFQHCEGSRFSFDTGDERVPWYDIIG